MRNFLLFIILLSSFQAGISQTETIADLYDTDRVKEIRLTFKQQAWPAILDSLRSNGSDLLVGQAKIDGLTYKNVGVRYRGSRSFKVGSKRNPLFIKLNFINKKQNHQGYKRIKLSNSLRDPSMVREVLGFEIARKYMIAPKANYVKVYVNDAYYGLFVSIEAVDKEFLETNFGSDDRTFFKSAPNFTTYAPDGCMPNVFGALAYEEDVNCYIHNYQLESDEGWDDLIALTDILNNKPAQIERVLDVDQTLWMLAFNNVLVNLSSYSGSKSQNYYLYQNEKGQFTPIIWDLNLAFGSYKSATNGSDLSLKELQNLDPLLHVNNKYKPLISQLLKNPTYKKTYLAHIRSIIYDNFENGWYEERATALQELIQGPFVDDSNQRYTYRDFQKSLTSTVGERSKIPGIIELMAKRSKVLKKHPTLRVIPPSISEVNVLKRGQYASILLNKFTISAKVDKLPKKVKLYYRYNKAESFTVVEMEDNGKNKDAQANDKMFTATVDKGTGTVEYYIVAENAASISFSPSNYMFEPYVANITEIN